MQPEETARASAKGIGDLPANFMLDGATYERGGSLGFDGVDFYIAGRAGALGDVDGHVVAAAFAFFEHGQIVEGWERARKVMAPLDAAAAFAGCLRSWAGAHLGEGPDYERLAVLAGKVTTGADIAGAPLFAAWSVLPEPDEPAATALHRLNLLRELRGARHAGSVLAAGLSPLEALSVKTPFIAAVFGWGEPLEVSDDMRERWARAEAGTDAAVGRAFAALEPSERGEFVALLGEVVAAVR
jgi:hypothetical protein